MDIFTHMFFTYLINFGIGSLRFNEYAMVFGIAMGVIPDFDVLWYPVGQRYSIARHRGISHSITFIVIATVILALIFAPIIKVDFIALCLIGIISGLSHICLDVLTTIGIPVFWPFSKRELHLDLERAINPYFMFISVILIFVLFQLRVIRFNYQIYLQIITIITTSIILYYLAKLILKLYIHKTFSSPGFKIKALPTAGFYKWFLVGKSTINDVMRLKYCKYNLLSKYKPRFRYFSCICTRNTEPPLDSIEKAKTYTFHLKEVKKFIDKFKYPIAEVLKNPSGHNWTVFWFPLELMSLDRAMAVRVDLDMDGKYRAKHAFFWKFAKI
ncbi:metal-dependent hydrolase [[Eubacterium] cellulosolvens]